MVEPDLSGLPLGPVTLEVVRRVVTGEADPAQGATELAGLWLPDGKTDQSGGLEAMYGTAANWANEGQIVSARRLAELTWLLAEAQGDDDTAVWCAAMLGQLMAFDPAAIRRRLELLEYAVPRIVASASPAALKAVMLSNLADARFNHGGGDPADLRATVEACEAALSLGLDARTVWSGRVHFIAGTVYQSIGDYEADDSSYRASIAHFQEALRCYPSEVAPDQHGGVLNNLGNTYRKLGARTGDVAWAEAAIQCFDQALPYRREEAQYRRTLRSRADAMRLLEEHRAGTQAMPPDGPGERGLSAINLLEAGDSAYEDSFRADANGEANRRLAFERYVAAARLLGRDGPARLRGEVYHRMIRPFVESTNDDALWTGICFAAAARRVGVRTRPPIALARSGVQLSFMLMKLGDGREVQYLRAAEALVRELLPLLAAEGEPGEAEYATDVHKACLTLLAANGDQNARPQALQLHAARQLERLELQAQDAPPDQLHAIYREYLSLVRRAAEDKLATLLAETELGYLQAVMDPMLGNELTSMAVAEAAEKRRVVGDLAGALELAAAAEKFAGDAHAWGPPAWCQLARFYAGIPLRDKAEESVRQARAAVDNVVTEPTSQEEMGWWLPLDLLDDFRSEIDATAALVAQDDAGPQFRPEVTVSALMLGARGGRLRQILEGFMRARRKAR